MGLTVLSLSPREKKQTGSRWWQNTLSFSSSSSTKSHSDDSVLDNRCFLQSPVHLNNRRTNSNNRNGRQLTRVGKFRHLADNEVDVFRVSSNIMSSPLPLPVPVPDLDVFLRRDVKYSSQRSNTVNVPLPSPKGLHHRRFSGDEKERQKLESFNNAFGRDRVTYKEPATSALMYVHRLSTVDGNRRVDNKESLSSRRSHRQPNGNRKIPNNYRISIPYSAPSSPFSSPGRSPAQLCPGDVLTTQFVTPPNIFQVWSAPEMPSSESTPDHGLCFQIRNDKAVYNGDNSPNHGPRLSPERSRKSYNESASPLCNKLLSMETQAVRRDNIFQVNVHPLPLPPGNPLPLPLSSVPLPPAKSELIPKNSQWQKGKLIGRGTFGSVYVASNKETGALCAMKEVEILPGDPKSAECIRQLEQEIKVLSNLKHPNIVQYYGSERVDDRLFIYLEYVHPGSINRFIHDHCGAITESVARNFTRHILCGLAYLHSTKTIHRDIKGANLLVDAYGVVKLADFGMAKHLNGHAANLSLKGSPYWMAPELLQADVCKDDSTNHALAVDIWSLGCTIIEMMNGKPPWSEYEGPAAMFKVLKETPPIPENLSAEGKDFLNCCFRRNPAERPTASMLLEHCFLKNPHPPPQDVLLSNNNQSFGGMKSADKVKTQGEYLTYKIDQVAASLDTEFLNRRLADNFKQDCFPPVRLF